MSVYNYYDGIKNNQPKFDVVNNQSVHTILKMFI